MKTVTTVPPGELGIELSDADALAVLDRQFQQMCAPPRLRVSQIKDIAIVKNGRWVTATVRFKDLVLIGGEEVSEFEVRMPRARAECVRLALNRELSK